MGAPIFSGVTVVLKEFMVVLPVVIIGYKGDKNCFFKAIYCYKNKCFFCFLDV